MSAVSTLAAIRDKVRKVTARPSTTQISDTEIDFYINTFYIYDLPEELRLFTLKTNYVFTTAPNTPVYDFPIETYTSVEQPIYVAGYQQVYHQDQFGFYSIWPKINFQETVGTGDGTTSPTLSDLANTPVLQKCVTLSATISGEASAFIDDGEGNFLNSGIEITNVSTAATAQITTNSNHNLVNGDIAFISGVFGTVAVNGGPFVVTVVDTTNFTIPVSTLGTTYENGGIVQRQAGTVDYITGALTMDWGNPTDVATDIIAQTVPYQASRPTDILFFENKFTFRPVPDQVYKVEVEVFIIPTQLLASSQTPELNQWWQYLAYGAALKIFADSGELEEYAKYEVLFDKQERLALRRTLQQLKTQRVQTPFTEEQSSGFGNYFPLF